MLFLTGCSDPEKSVLATVDEVRFITPEGGLLVNQVPTTTGSPVVGAAIGASVAGTKGAVIGAALSGSSTERVVSSAQVILVTDTGVFLRVLYNAQAALTAATFKKGDRVTLTLKGKNGEGGYWWDYSQATIIPPPQPLPL